MAKINFKIFLIFLILFNINTVLVAEIKTDVLVLGEKLEAPQKLEKPIKNNIDTKQQKIEKLKPKIAINEKPAKVNTKGEGEPSDENYGSPSGQGIHPAVVDYYGEVRRIIVSNWVPPTSNVPLDAVAYFDLSINTNGRIVYSKLFKTSGSPDYDLSVERAIRKSVFPALPAAFEGKRASIRLEFKLKDIN